MDTKPVRVCDTCYTKLNNNDINGKTIKWFFFKILYLFSVFLDSRSNQRDRTADSSDSDGDESNPQYSPIPVCRLMLIF